MSADLLRRAAVKLCEHAKVATPGPWEADAFGLYADGWIGRTDASAKGEANARLIALMHPPAAHALAELLSGTADDMGVEINKEGNCTRCGLRFDLRREDECMCWFQAFDVARAVLREEES